MRKILVVYFSRSGNTRQVAEELARSLKADLEAIVDPTPRAGFFGYMRSGRQAFFKTIVPIAAPKYDPAGYDLVVVGTPIWNASLSTPVRSYLRRHRSAIRSAAFFCTFGGMAMDRVFRQMSDESGRSPVAVLGVREKDLGTIHKSPAIDEFVTKLRSR